MPGKPSSKQRESKRDGKADTFIFPNGEKYTGEFVDCGNGRIERNGEGTHTFASGLVYNGGWVKDKMNGTGEMVHPNGSMYKGAFLNNEYHGSGLFKWPDGSIFTGQFINNRVSGNGEFKDNTGRVWIGDFSNDLKKLLTLKLS